MYFWVILATFLAMLASYSLSSRSDIRELTVEPLAESHVAKLITKHKMADIYVEQHKPQFGDEFQQVTYVPNKQIPEEDGSEEDGLDTIYLNNGVQTNDKTYQSWIYCTNNITNKNYDEPADCDRLDTSKYLFTMGPIPRRWINLVDGTPNVDYLNAMRKLGGEKIGLGYIDNVKNIEILNPEDNETHSSWGIRNQTKKVLFIPRSITTDGDAFKRLCIENICIIYVTGI